MDRSTFTELVRKNGDSADVAALGRTLAWADTHELRDTWASKSAHGDEWVPVMRRIEWDPAPFGIGTTPPRLFVSGENLRDHHPFRMDARWRIVLERLYEIPEVAQTKKGSYPAIRLHDLVGGTTWVTFFQVIEDMMAEVRRSAERGIR